LQLKTAVIEDLLLRSSDPRLQQTQFLLKKTIPSPDPFGYRQRIRLLVTNSGQLGYRKLRSHSVAKISNCLLAARPLNRVLEELPRFPDFQLLSKNISELELLLDPGSGKVIALLHFSRNPRPGDIKSARILCAQLDTLERIFFTGDCFQLTGPFCADEQLEAQYGKTLHIQYVQIDDHPDPLDLQWEVGGFFQVNPEQNTRLINMVLQFSNTGHNETVLDLFCGMGNFSIPLARRAKSILGFEGQGGAIRSARANSIRNNLTNTVFTKKPIHDACQQLVTEKKEFDCVIVDPPRKGIPGLAGDIAFLARKRLVYISCDPATLCRDLTELCRVGFTIENIQPFDMFPQTHHIETVVALSKS
jgi:23S rRNA (uracil1939-C5)-methyltransferase